MDNVDNIVPLPPTFDIGRAWCVSHANFVRLAQTTLEHGFQEHVLLSPEAVEKGIAVNALVTDLSNATVISAHNIRIQSWTFDLLVNGYHQWRVLHEGSAKCTNCFEAKVPLLPFETKMVSASALLDAGADGLLYLATVGR